MSDCAKNVISNNWRSLIKPADFTIKQIKENECEFQVEPLPRGFGVTMGNVLRRVLLSVLHGAAITAVKITGVEHEFSTIQGVREDVVDIILALKKVVVKYGGSDRRKLSLKAAGPCVITAGMIDTPSDVEIINKDQIICHLNHDAIIDMEFYVQIGSGYKCADDFKDENFPKGFIAMDALFTPINNVNCKVENSRVGSDTELDKLNITIETNGSIAPDLALSIAAKVAQDQLSTFVSFTEEVDHKEEEPEDDSLPFDPSLLKKVDHLELSVRSYNCLQNDNIKYIGDLVVRTESDMLKTPNFGRKSLNEIIDILDTYGLRFGMDIQDWPPENVEELSKQYEDIE